MNFKFVPDLFLEVVELQKFKDSLDSKGWRQNLLQNSEKFGLIKSVYTDPSFLNAKVTQDTDVGSDKSVQINQLYGIDKSGQFIYQPAQRNLVIPNDGNWHWIKVARQITNQEIGVICSIATDGTLSVTGGTIDLTQLFRGMPYFPTRIKFVNSSNNLLEYDVTSVIDTSHATLQHPGNMTGTPSSFVAETGLGIIVVGTFTPGVSIPGANKNIFEYDFCNLTLVTETVANTRPVYSTDIEFFLARVKRSGSSLIIQDKRIDYWKSRGAAQVTEITRASNPLIGIEAVKFDASFTTQDTNIVEVAWGFRGNNWTVDTSLNKVSMAGPALGGKYKTYANFTNGDFDGWRFYSPSGVYSKIVSSVKVGGTINLTLDILDVDNFSTDGGTTFMSGFVLCVPDVEEVMFKFEAFSGENPLSPGPGEGFMTQLIKEIAFPVNQLIGRVNLPVQNTPYGWWKVSYCYKAHWEYTAYQVIPSDLSVGYFIESDFDARGNLIDPGTAVSLPYNSSNLAFLRLTLAPGAYHNLVTEVYRGDLYGVTNYTAFSPALIPLRVGTAKVYHYVTGSIILGSHVRFNLLSAGAVDYNVFQIHLNCTDIALSGYKIYIMQDYTLITEQTLRIIDVGDIYEMKNRDKGIIFNCVYDAGIGQWIVSQSYDLGQPNEIKMVPGSTTGVFDGSTGMGLVKGWFGWKVFTPLQGRVPIGAGSYTEASGTYTRVPGDTGGEVQHKLVSSEMPVHTHTFTGASHTHTFTANPHAHTYTEPNSGAGHSHYFNFRARGGAGGTDYKTIQVDAGNNSYLGQDPGTGGSDVAYTAFIQNAQTGITINNANVTGTTDASTATGTNGNAGGDGYHENMPPWYALTFAQKQY